MHPLEQRGNEIDNLYKKGTASFLTSTTEMFDPRSEMRGGTVVPVTFLRSRYVAHLLRFIYESTRPVNVEACRSDLSFRELHCRRTFNSEQTEQSYNRIVIGENAACVRFFCFFRSLKIIVCAIREVT